LPISPLNLQALVSDEDLRILDDPRFTSLSVPAGIRLPPDSRLDP